MNVLMKDIGGFCRFMLSQFYRDFKAGSRECDRLCQLKQVQFDDGSNPDYSKPLVQSLYLLRYGPAYLAEYFMIYQQLLHAKCINSNMCIISLGCGCGIDYWGMKYAFMSCGVSDRTPKYLGYDKIGWNYRNIASRIPGTCDVSIHEHDMVSRPLRVPYDCVVIFPKSLCELNDSQMDQLIITLKTSKINCRRLVLISSFGSNPTDQHRIDMICNAICDTFGYIVAQNFNRDDMRIPMHEYIAQCIPGYRYSDEILKAIKDIRSFCRKYRCNGTHGCNGLDCKKSLARYPMLKTQYFRWCTYVLQKAS